MGFKDCVNADLKVFLGTDEFAAIHNIDGQDIPAVIDDDIVKTRSNNKTEQYDGVYSSQKVVFVKSSDMPDRPVFGQHLKLDGKIYQVQECTDSDGMMEITLGVNDA